MPVVYVRKDRKGQFLYPNEANARNNNLVSIELTDTEIRMGPTGYFAQKLKAALDAANIVLKSAPEPVAHEPEPVVINSDPTPVKPKAPVKAATPAKKSAAKKK